jgi:hypothetical protein
VFGSYSVGGISTVPSDPLIPIRTCSRSPVRNAPITGPVVREKGYSMIIGARNTPSAVSLVLILR